MVWCGVVWYGTVLYVWMTDIERKERGLELNKKTES